MSSNSIEKAIMSSNSTDDAIMSLNNTDDAIMSSNSTADASPSDTILTSLSLYVPLLCCVFVLFEYVRRRFDLTYTPRKRSESVRSPIAERAFGLLAWIPPAISTSDQEILEQCGLDSLCFLRFLRMGQKLAVLGIAMSVVLFPVYATSTHSLDKNRTDIDPLERITMSNIDEHDLRIWSSVLAMYIMTAFAFFLFVQEYKIYTHFRHQFLGHPGPQQYTIVINDLPRNLRSKAALTQYMTSLFPGDIASVDVAINCDNLEKKVARRREVLTLLERSLLTYRTSGKRPSHRPIKLQRPACTPPVDSIQHYEAKLDSLNKWILEEIKSYEDQEAAQIRNSANFEFPAETLGNEDQQEDDPSTEFRYSVNDLPNADSASGDHPPLRMRRSAFVTLRTLKAAQVARQVLQTQSPVAMTVLPAPAPQDIIWENIGGSWRERKLWGVVSWTSTVLIILFWTFPTAFVTSLATVEKLSEYFPVMRDLFAEFPALAEFVKQLAPILLITMTMVAALIFGALSRKEGHPSLTQVNASLFSKLVYFQIFQIFFVSVLAGTVFDSLASIMDKLNDPRSIVTLLGKTLPNQSTYFMVYLIVQAGVKLTLELLRILPIIFALVFRLGRPKGTDREKEATSWLIFRPTSEPGFFDQTEKLPNYFLAVLLIFAFCAIAPLVTYVAGAFLLMSEVVYRRQLLFVYDPSTFSTGVFWPKLHDCLVGALLMAQVTLLGLMWLKLTPGPIFAATLLPFSTVVYYCYFNSLWPNTAKNLPLNLCAKIDGERLGGQGSKEGTEKGLSIYAQPVLLEGGELRADDPGGNDLGSLEGVKVGERSEVTALTTNGDMSDAGIADLEEMGSGFSGVILAPMQQQQDSIA